MYKEATSFIFLSLILSMRVTALETPEWLEPIIPHRGATLQEEIKCYSLPYGGIGFVSHALTYWALFWIWKGRRPYMPWRRLFKSKFDMVLCSLQIVVTVAVAAFTIARCKNRWQFVTIAVWKLLLSLEVGIWGFRAAIWARQNGKNENNGSNLLEAPGIMSSNEDQEVIGQKLQWFLLTIYALVTTSALVGLVSLIIPIWQNLDIKVISAVFIIVAGAALLTFFFWLFCRVCIKHRYSGVNSSDTNGGHHKPSGTRDRSLTSFAFGLFIGLVSVLMFLFALYCDWVLAVIAGNYAGVPSGDNAALYWTYFAAKRLPLLLT